MDNIYKAMADSNRRKVLQILKNGEKSVSEILREMEIGQATLSNHLSILKKAGLVVSRTNGKMRIYRLRAEAISNLIVDVHKMFETTKIEDIIMRR